MAKRRRRKGHGKTTHRKRRKRRSAPIRHRKRRRRHSPIRHRRGRRHHVRRNPGGIIGDLMGVGLPAMGGGILANFVSGKIASKIGGTGGGIAGVLTKVAIALGSGLVARRFAPRAAGAVMAGAFGAIGADLGARFAGGLPAIPSKEAAVKGLARMAAEDDEMGVLLTEEMKGMGILIQGLGAASTDQMLEGYGSNGVGAYVDQSPGYGEGE